MFSAETLKAAQEKAKQAKKSLSRYLPGSQRACDCTECYGCGINRPEATIETHYRRFHCHPDSLRAANNPLANLPLANLPHADPSPPNPLLSPCQADLDDQPNNPDVDDNLVLPSPLSPNPLPGSTPHSQARAWSLSLSLSCLRLRSWSLSLPLSCSRSQSLSCSQSPSHSSSSSQSASSHVESQYSPLRSPSWASSSESEDILMHPGNPDFDALLFGRHLNEPQDINQPPPLRLRGGHGGEGEGGDDGDDGEPDEPDEQGGPEVPDEPDEDHQEVLNGWERLLEPESGER
ncbi:hypothetical protein FRC08_016122 [Ceratobasidium sp. 394]|nr:hypothetical protein FRC08_016122 [Ceratobasidium sp. 394]